MLNEFSQRVISIIKQIPPGKVLTYGAIAALAGNPRAARQVARLLHTLSKKYALPWHRVINSSGKISLTHPADYREQQEKLEAEGITFSLQESVDLNRYLWQPGPRGK